MIPPPFLAYGDLATERVRTSFEKTGATQPTFVVGYLPLSALDPFPPRFELVAPEYDSDASKTRAAEHVKSVAHVLGANFVLYVSEVWFMSRTPSEDTRRRWERAKAGERLRPGEEVRHQPDRREGIFLRLETDAGTVARHIEITRDAKGRPTLGPTPAWKAPEDEAGRFTALLPPKARRA
jgi:hypothetical protein